MESYFRNIDARTIEFRENNHFSFVLSVLTNSSLTLSGRKG